MFAPVYLLVRVRKEAGTAGNKICPVFILASPIRARVRAYRILHRLEYELAIDKYSWNHLPLIILSGSDGDRGSIHELLNLTAIDSTETDDPQRSANTTLRRSEPPWNYTVHTPVVATQQTDHGARSLLTDAQLTTPASGPSLDVPGLFALQN